MYQLPPRTRTRMNYAFPGLAILIGSLLIGFGSTQPWATVDIQALQALGVPLTPSHKFGFDRVYTKSGPIDGASAAYVAIAVWAALCGLALLATRVRVLGIFFRLALLLGIAPVAYLTFEVWQAVNDPASAINSAFGLRGLVAKAVTIAAQELSDSSLASFGPGLGLWLTTLGLAMCALGGVIPAMRRDVLLQGPTQYFPGYSGTPYAPPSAPTNWTVQSPLPGSSAQFGPTSYWPGKSDRG